MNSSKKELGRTKALKDAKRIFLNSENYSDNELLGYGNILQEILGIESFNSIKDNDINLAKLIHDIQILTSMEIAVIQYMYGVYDGVRKSSTVVASKLNFSFVDVSEAEYKALRTLRQTSKSGLIISEPEERIKREEKRLTKMLTLPQSASITELNLTPRTCSCLRQAGIYTIAQLINTSNSDLLSLQELSKTAYEELVNFKKIYNSKNGRATE